MPEVPRPDSIAGSRGRTGRAFGESSTSETSAVISAVLDTSASHLCDIEKGRKVVSPERTARFAKILGRPQQQFVRLALQALVNEAGLKMKVDVSAA